MHCRRKVLTLRKDSAGGMVQGMCRCALYGHAVQMRRGSPDCAAALPSNGAACRTA